MTKMLKRLKNEDGFTLIEMTIVILVIAVLMIVFIPNLTDVNSNVSKTTDKALKQTVEAQIILYEAQEDEPFNLDDLQKKGYITPEQLKAYNDLQGN